MIGKPICYWRAAACRDSVLPFHRVSFCQVWDSRRLITCSSAPLFHQGNHWGREKAACRGWDATHTHAHMHIERHSCRLQVNEAWSVCCMYALIEGKRGSLSADAHTIRSCKDGGERKHNRSHSCSYKTGQKGRDRTAGNEMSYLLLSAVVVYSMNQTRLWGETGLSHRVQIPPRQTSSTLI